MGIVEIKSIALVIKRTINYLSSYKALCVANKMYTLPLPGLRIQGNKRREEDIQLDL
jgi:hypothetical protein